jgi:hypothetical protein
MIPETLLLAFGLTPGSLSRRLNRRISTMSGVKPASDILRNVGNLSL